MSFVHCHTCDWEQDDFWSWSYNPIQTFFSYVRSMKLWKPRVLEGDKPTYPVHSYTFIWRQMKRAIRKFRTMHWWTWNSYQRSDRRCPICSAKLCVD